MKTSDVYHNPQSAIQTSNVADFIALAKRYEWLDLRQPNSASPWHWAGYVPCHDGTCIVLNFWPHKGRAQREDRPSVAGYDAIRAMISEAIEDSVDEDFGCVVE